MSIQLKSYYNFIFRDPCQLKGVNTPELDFQKEDFLMNTSWVSQFDIVFMNATCFETDMLDKI